MCGLIARWGAPASRDAMRDPLEAALAAMARRGPDGRGTWFDPAAGVALGHARLALIDLAGGAQPHANEDGSIVAIVNGELYDFEARRAALQTAGHRFRTRCDSELLVHLYEERGLAALDELRGEFAFVLWDARLRRLFAARDRFGIKPLLYADHANALWLASTAKALFAAGVQARWDLEGVAQSFAHQYIAPSHTLFAGIRELPPGHYLVRDHAGVRVAAYFDLAQTYAEHDTLHVAALHGAGDDTGGALHRRRDEPDAFVTDTLRGGGAVDDASSTDVERAASARIRAALEDAVATRLRADVPVAAYLSGGLDSSLVVALAARHTPITAFGIAFEHAPYDEHRDAAAFAESIGVPFHAVPVTQDAILEHLPDAVEQAEGLCINGQLSAKYLLARAVHEAGYKVVLAGEGADEAFYGYAHLVRDFVDAAASGVATGVGSDLQDGGAFAAQAGSVAAASAFAAQAGSVVAGSAFAAQVGSVVAGSAFAAQAGIMLPLGDTLGLPAWLAAKREVGQRMLPLLAPLLRDVVARDPARQLLEVLGLDRAMPLVDRAAISWSRLALARYILRTLGDGTEMAFSVEGRLPFLDPHVWAAARRVPAAAHLRAGIAKRLLRAAARGVVPEHIAMREKRPLLAPPITRFASARSRDLVRDAVRTATRILPWFDRDATSAWADSLDALPPDAQRAAEPLLMTILSASALHQRLHLGFA